MSSLTIFYDISGWFPDYRPDVILDVGAHQGDYSRKYAERWPNAKIFAFEPHPVTAAMLGTILPERIQVHSYALSSITGRVPFTDKPCDSSNRVNKDGPLWVDCIRGDDWMEGMFLDHVSLLKIDAEGHDVEVLAGFGDRLQDVDFVVVETMLNRHDPQGTFYADAYDYMTSQGFYVFGLYDFVWEWRRGDGSCMVDVRIKEPDGSERSDKTPGAPIGRRCDTAYINPKFVKLAEGYQ